MIQQHEDTYDENNIRDFVDLYIQISRQEQVDNKEVFTSRCDIRGSFGKFLARHHNSTMRW